MMRLCVKSEEKHTKHVFGHCGEHMRNPESTLCHIIGLNYVSCSPSQDAVARLAAARLR